MMGRKTFLEGSLWGTTLGGRFCLPCFTGEPTGAPERLSDLFKVRQLGKKGILGENHAPTVATVRVAAPSSELEGHRAEGSMV